MLQRTITIAVSVLALSLVAFASKAVQTREGETSPEPRTASRVGAYADRIQASSGRGANVRLTDVDHKPPRHKTSVPEPGSLLAFGTAMLIGATVLRKSVVR